MRVIYTGPSDGASIRLPDGTSRDCPRDQPVELPADVARQLLEQGWEEPAATPPPKAPARKAHARRAKTTTTEPGTGQED